MKRSKQLMTFLCALLLVMPLLSMVSVKAATNTDFKIDYDVDLDGSGDLDEGDEFDLKLDITNESGSKLSELYVIIKQTSSFFTPPNEESQKKITDLENDSSFKPEFKLKYNGSGNAVTVILKYKKAKSNPADEVFEETEKDIYVEVDDDSGSSSSSTSTNTSEYQPKLIAIVGNKMPVFNAGITNTFSFTVENQSNHYAKDVKITLDFDSDLSKAITINKAKLFESISKISANKEKKVLFDISFSAGIKEGTYPVKIKYDYQNAYSDSYTTEETVYIKIKNSNMIPDIQIKKIYLDKAAVSRGEKLNLNVDIINNGSLTANSLDVSLIGLDAETMSVYNDTISEGVDSLKGSAECSVNFPIMILNEAKSGNYPVDIEIEYEDYDDEIKKVTRKGYIYIEVEKDEDAPNIEVVKVNKPSFVYQDKAFDITLSIKNTGKVAADNLKIKISNESGFYPTSSNLVTINSLAGEEQQDVTFSFISDSNATAKYYPLEVNFEYEDSRTGNEEKATHYTGMNIQEESKPSVPKIIIENYEYSTGKVIAGKEFDLIMTLYNTSKTSDVRNIKVTLTSSDGTFTPTESSSSLYVDSMGKNEKIQQSIKLMPKVDLTSKSYQMTVKVEYEGNDLVAQPDSDDKTPEITQEEILSIPVFQEPRLEVSELNVPMEMPAGQEIPIYLDFYNMGRSILYNLLVKLEGDFEGRDTNYFAGNFSQGSSDYYEINVMAMNEGPAKGAVIFTFEDDLGNQHEVRKEFEVNITPPMEISMEEGAEFGPEAIEAFKQGDMKPGMEKENNNKLYYIIGGALAVAIIILIIVIKRRRKKKELLEDE